LGGISGRICAEYAVSTEINQYAGVSDIVNSICPNIVEKLEEDGVIISKIK
jgi:hypothetical protein